MASLEELVDELLDDIEAEFQHMLERPHMYASTPEALEVRLVTLEGIREHFLAGRLNSPQQQGGYDAYWEEHEFGACGFVARHRKPTKLTSEDLELFHKLRDYWKLFLESPHRMERHNRLSSQD